MRRLVWLCVIAAILWCVWWAIAAFGLTSGVSGWFRAQAGEGVRATVSDVRPRGFPSRVEAHLGAIELGDKGSQDGVTLDGLVLSARTLWPGDMQVRFPTTPMRLTNNGVRWTLVADAAQADLNLHPGAALELEHMSLTSGPFRVEDTVASALMGGAGLVARMEQQNRADSYSLTFDIANFTPGERVRQLLELPEAWPLIFETFSADALVRFDKPLDRSDLEPNRPPAQPQSVDVSLAEIRWGDMLVSTAGSVVRDAQGRAEGSLVIKAENWTRMVDIAERAGILPQEFRPQVEGILRGLAQGTGRTDALDITLTFANGLTRVGFIPIGPAPSMELR